MKHTGLVRLGRDADLRYTESGTAVANLALAYNYGKKENGDQPTQWVQASLWGKRAESLAPYLLKGTAIVAYMSETHIATFRKQDGTEGYALQARIDDIELVPGQRQGQQPQRQAPQSQQSSGQQYREQSQGGDGFSDDLDDDIPF